MKTDQLMRVQLDSLPKPLEIYHLSQFGRLDELWEMGNAFRTANGMKSTRLKSWLESVKISDFVKYVTDMIGRPAVKTTKGRYAKTSAHLHILLAAAADLHPKLKYEVQETFIQNRLLALRDDSGDEYIELNAAITLAAEEILGKPAHKGHYINIAKIIKDRVNPTNWNVASANQLDKRMRIEQTLTEMLKANLVRDWSHLKELAGTVNSS